MGENTLAIKVTADVVDLQTKFGVASATAKTLTKDFNDLAKQSAQGLLDPAGIAQLEQASRAMLEAKASVASLKEEMRGAHEEFEGVGGVLEDIHGKLSAAFEVTGIAAVVEGVKEFAEAIEQAGEQATQLRATAEILGVTTDQIQAMKAAAAEGGTSFESFAHAGERLTALLTEARDGSGAAREKLFALGVTMNQIADPAFNYNSILQVLHDRLTDEATAHQTMSELVKELGARFASAAEAIKEYDGSFEGVKAKTGDLNSLNEQQIKTLHEMGVAVDETKTRFSNFFSGLIAKAGEAWQSLQKFMGVEKGPGVSKYAEEESPDNKQAQSAARQQVDLQREMAQQELQNIQAGVEAYKQGSAQKLAQLQILAEATAAYYGADSDKAQAAQRQVIAQQRAYLDAQATLREEQVRAEFKADDDEAKAKLASISTKIHAEDQYLLKQQEESKQAKEIADAIRSMEETGLEMQTHIYQERAKTSAQMNSLVRRETQEQLQQWQFLTNGLKNGFANAFQGILSGTETVGQAIKGIFSSVLDGIISKLAEWAAEWITNLLITHAASTTTAAAQATNNAGVAASAAMGSVAAIPFIGWAMAPEVGASTYAEALAIGLPKASGGYDIPSSMNPIVQAHGGEMILPASISQGFRNIISRERGDSMGGGGGSRNTTLNINWIPVGNGSHGLVSKDELGSLLKTMYNQFKLA